LRCSATLTATVPAESPRLAPR